MGRRVTKINGQQVFAPDCRWATKSEQMLNRGLFINNKSGVAGVSWHKRFRVWQANCQENGRQVQLYRGCNLFEACCARKSWESRREQS